MSGKAHRPQILDRIFGEEERMLQFRPELHAEIEERFGLTEADLTQSQLMDRIQEVVIQKAADFHLVCGHELSGERPSLVTCLNLLKYLGHFPHSQRIC